MARSSTLTLILRRMLAAIPSVFGVVILTFVLTRALPGDPAAYFAGPAASQEAIAQIRETLGLNRSLLEQFFIYLGELSRGDLGNSLTTGQTVLSDLLTRLPASLELTLAGLIFSLTFAIPLDVLAATRPGSWVDHAVRVAATAGVSLPTFFTGLLLIYVYYFLLGIAPAPLGRLAILYSPPTPVTGLFLIDSLLAGDLETFWATLSQLVLPAITLGLFALAPLARVTRAAMLAVLSSDFVRTARASGLSPATILFGCAGYFGGWCDRIISRIVDTIMAFPLFVLAMGLVAALGNTVENIIYATAIINLPLYTRVVRSEVLVRREAGYIEAARLSGNSHLQIMMHHLFPNVLPVMMVHISLNMGWAILNAAGLSFIGLGVRPPTPEWGIMVAEGATYIISGEWWLAMFPGLVLMLAVFCFNLLGDGLRDLIDPRLRT